MASLEGIRTRHYLAEGKVARILDDQPVAIRIAYNGASTTAPVISVITATSLTLTDSIATTTFTFGSGYGTLALLAAGISAVAGYTARVMDALPSTITTASNIIVSSGLVAKTVNGETVYDALLDTSTTKMVSYRVAYDRNVISQRARGSHRVKIVGFEYNVNVSAGEAAAVRIYEFNKVDGTTNLVWAALSVDATVTTVDFSASPLTASDGNEFIVAVTDGTSVTDASTNYLQVSFIRE